MPSCPSDIITEMPPATSLGFGVRFVNKWNRWSPKATLVKLRPDAISKSDVSGASVALEASGDQLAGEIGGFGRE
jgi:hypothetical protein